MIDACSITTRDTEVTQATRAGRDRRSLRSSSASRPSRSSSARPSGGVANHGAGHRRQLAHLRRQRADRDRSHARERAARRAAVLTALLINTRLLVYSASLSQHWRDQPPWFRVDGRADDRRSGVGRGRGTGARARLSARDPRATTSAAAITLFVAWSGVHHRRRRCSAVGSTATRSASRRRCACCLVVCPRLNDPAHPHRRHRRRRRRARGSHASVGSRDLRRRLRRLHAGRLDRQALDRRPS